MWSAIIGTVGSLISGFFGIKKSQADIIQSGVDLVKDVQSSEAAAKVAAMQAVAAEARSESWITRTWRPIASAAFCGLLIAYFFGYAPSNLMADTMPPYISRLFDIVEVIILAGYPSRTVDKVVREIQLGKILKTIAEKKFL